MMKAVCCTRCQSVGLESYIHSGSVRKGLLLLSLFIVPGVLYFLWYLIEGHKGCSTCGSRRIVPIEDPDTMKAGYSNPMKVVQGFSRS
jgi:hypothetical protein